MKKRNYRGELYNATDFLNDIRDPKPGSGMPDGSWDVNFGYTEKTSIDQQMQHDQNIIAILYEFKRLEKSKNLHWHEVTRVRWYIEQIDEAVIIGNNRFERYNYLQRDKVCAAALMMGLPVKIDPNDKSKNMIGLYLTDNQLETVYTKVKSKVQSSKKYLDWVDFFTP